MAQTLEQALHLARTGESKRLARAANVLDGLPVGGWPSTNEAMHRLVDDLPFRAEREYTREQFIARAYTIEHADARTSGIYRCAL